MNKTRADEIRNGIAVVLVPVISVSGFAAVGFCFFLFGNPDGTLRTPVVEFLLPALSIYLLFTFVGAVIGAWLWRAAPVLLALIAAIPYLLAAFGNGIIWLGTALFTFGVHYIAFHFRRTHVTTAAPPPAVF